MDIRKFGEQLEDLSKGGNAASSAHLGLLLGGASGPGGSRREEVMRLTCPRIFSIYKFLLWNKFKVDHLLAGSTFSQSRNQVSNSMLLPIVAPGYERSVMPVKSTLAAPWWLWRIRLSMFDLGAEALFACIVYRGSCLQYLSRVLHRAFDHF